MKCREYVGERRRGKGKDHGIKKDTAEVFADGYVAVALNYEDSTFQSFPRSSRSMLATFRDTDAFGVLRFRRLAVDEVSSVGPRELVMLCNIKVYKR